MTSLDDIFLQATKSGGDINKHLLWSSLSLQCLDLNNSYKSQIHEGDQDPGEEDDEQYVPHHEELLERGERASLETSAVYVDPNTSTNL